MTSTQVAPQGAVAVLLVNLGTPDAPTEEAVRRYLAEFLSDKRVVAIPKLVWWPILHGIVLRTRPAKSAAKYASVWMPEGSPLAVWTQRQARLLQAAVAQRGDVPPGLLIDYAMRYGSPSVAERMDALVAHGARQIIVLPMYPQYATATTASVQDAVDAWVAERTRRGDQQRQPINLQVIQDHHDDAAYIDALAARIQAHWQQRGRAEKLVLSFHGMPAYTVKQGDPYYGQCLASSKLLRERLSLSESEVLVTFQSRFGKAKWIEPYTEPTLIELAKQGVKSVDVACPGFVADCLETLEEIDQEAREAFLHAGGSDFRYIPCLNDDAAWIQALTALVAKRLAHS